MVTAARAGRGGFAAMIASLAFVPLATAAPPPAGTPVQLPTPNACYSTTAAGGCSAFGGSLSMNGAQAIAITPDGTDVYTAGDNGGSVAFTRSSAGALQAFGPIGYGDTSYAVDATGLFAGERNTGGSNGDVVALSRAPNGTVTPVNDVSDSCPAGSSCASDNGLYDVEGVALSSDGTHLYAASLSGGGATGGALTVFTRDPTTQAITEVQCLAQTATASGLCSTGGSNTGVGGAQGLAATPDGHFLYMAGRFDNSVVGFNVIQSGPNAGKLGSRVNCLWQSASNFDCSQAPGLTSADGIALSPDGRNAYVSAFNAGIAVLNRDPVSGVLSFNQCFTQTGGLGCSADPSLIDGGRGVVVSPDGRFVYLSGGSGTSGFLRTYARDPTTGQLTPLACLSYLAAPGCSTAAGLQNAFKLVLSPDGRNLYVTAFNGGDGKGAVAAFRIQTAPVCTGASVSVQAGASVVLPLACTDDSGDPITRQIATVPSKGSLGTVDQSAGTVTYTANAGATGTDSVAFNATDGTNTSGAATITITITGSSAGPPSITHASLTHKRFRVSAKPTALTARTRKAPLGTTFRFTLSTVATVRIQIRQLRPGLRKGHRCVAPSSTLRHAHAKRCTRLVSKGTLVRSSEPQGADAVAFSGRLGHTPLRPGSYRAALSASNAAGSSRTQTLSFKVVR
jgi:6-phosphogluconolactonase (cycloisomerase 2 family)